MSGRVMMDRRLPLLAIRLEDELWMTVSDVGGMAEATVDVWPEEVARAQLEQFTDLSAGLLPGARGVSLATGGE